MRKLNLIYLFLNFGRYAMSTHLLSYKRKERQIKRQFAGSQAWVARLNQDIPCLSPGSK